MVQLPRPVSDAALEAMLGRTEDLAKRWALELIAALPLTRAGEIPLEALARRAPGVIALVLGSVGSEAELERLAGVAGQASDVASVGELAGARDQASAVAAVETLRGVLWSELVGELDHPAAQLVADLAGRLAHVCSQVTIAVLGGGREGASERGPLDRPAPRRPLGPSPEPRIEIHDVRASGPAAWITSIGRCLDDHAESGEPFAVELIEVIGIERLRHSEDAGELQRLAGEIQGALRGELRPLDILTRESEGRYWLVAPGTDGLGATMLAERLIAVVRSSVSHRGVPLEVAIGIATCPADGREAAELAAQADMKLYGARAAGLSMAPPDAD
jgi:GGDEF domain-containing protein